VACPAENTWLAYVGGELEAAAIDRLDHHLDACVTCRQLYAGIARDDGHAATQPAAPSPWPLGSARERDVLDLSRGTPIGRYMVLGPIGRGGMGVVYKAYDPELDRAIALKLVAFDGLNKTSADALRQRLLREAKTLAQLSHPNVVAVYDVGTFGDSVFVAMEFVAGRSLRSWLRAEQRRPRDILAVFASAGAGLAAAHEQAIVHRDFKPENVMVGDDGRVRVLDFGLAFSPAGRAAARPSLGELAANDDGAQLTREGSVLGTPAYMAPEQDAGEEVDARGDQFSFCASLYEALFGQRPFAGTTYLEMAAHRAAGEIEAPPAVGGVRAGVRAAVLRGLRTAPAERHRDMGALLAELGKRAWYVRTRFALAALAVAALAAAGWAVWATRHAPPSIEDTCATAGHEIDSVWNPDVKQALEHQMIATGHPRGQTIAYHVEGAIDDWAEQWSKARAAVCELAMRSDGAQETHTADRLQCLQRRLVTLGANIAILRSQTQPEIVSGAEGMIANVPKPSSCDRLTDETPTEPAIKTMQPVIDEIVKGQLAAGKGDYSGAIEHARIGIQRARSLASPAEAPALLQLGQLQTVAGHYTEAGDTLREAVMAASRIKDDGLVLDAWLAILDLSALGSRLDWHAEQAIFGAELAVAHTLPDDPRRAQLAFRIGTVRMSLGDLDEADRQLHAAQAAWQKLGPDPHVLQLAGVDLSLGQLAMFRGEFPEAHRSLERSLAIWQRYPPNLGWAATEFLIGNTLEFELRHDEARAMFERALHTAETVPGQQDVLLAQVHFGLAWNDLVGGRCDRGAPQLAQTEPLFAKAYGRDSAAYAMMWIGQAMCALWAHDDGRAIDLFERARAQIGEYPISPVQRLGTELLLSHAYRRRGDVRKADALASSACARLAKVPGARGLFDELDHRLNTARH
jgi:tetratricopeptide (TPR) repeat protein/predicted Ser/Thr protein kinase